MEALKEVKRQLMQLTILLIGFFVIGWLSAGTIMNALIGFMPSTITITTFSPMEAFNTVFEISAIFAIACTIPFILVFFYHYAKDALFEHERRMMLKLIGISIGLFVMGSVLSFFGFVVLGINWFAEFGAYYGFTNTFWGLQHTIGFIMSVSLWSGVVFLFPIPTYFAIRYRLIDIQLDMQKRLIFLFILLMITGVIIPDGTFFSQIILSFPIMLLTEITVYLGIRSREVSPAGEENTKTKQVV